MYNPVGKNHGSAVLRTLYNMPIFWALKFFLYFQLLTSLPLALHYFKRYIAPSRVIFETFCLLIGMYRGKLALEHRRTNRQEPKPVATLDGRTMKKTCRKDSGRLTSKDQDISFLRAMIFPLPG